MEEHQAELVDHGGLAIASNSGANRGYVSRTNSVIDTVNGTHNYTVKGYSLTKGMGIGKYLVSSIFTVGGYEWKIHFYPDGKNQEEDAYISVFVALASEGNVRALFELILLDQSGNGNHMVHSHFGRQLERGPHILERKGSMWGFKRYIRKERLETSDFLKDDYLTMNCTIGIVQIHTEAPRQLSIVIPPPDMGIHLGGILETGIGSDIAFEVGDETFKAHKVILAARSPVFQVQFYGINGYPKIKRVVLKDIEPLVFKAMLMYMYSDILPDVDELVGLVSGFTSTVLIQDLLVAADHYGLDRLKLLCEENMCQNISLDTAAKTLVLAEKYHCVHLRDACLNFAALPHNIAAFMRSLGFDYLMETCPHIISEILAHVAKFQYLGLF